MTDHDGLCPFSRPNLLGGAPLRCKCSEYSVVRADERERIARAIVAERDSRPVMDTDSPWRALTVAARIARSGGSE